MENITGTYHFSQPLGCEVYLPFESTVCSWSRAFDNLFDLFEHDPEFKASHLGGQTIVLDDYTNRQKNREQTSALY